MNYYIKVNRRNTYILLLLFLVIFILTFSLYFKTNSLENKKIATMNSYKTESACEQLIINTYLNDIQQATNVFYSQYYTINPTVAYYVITVKEINSERKHGTENSTYTITFISEPYIGPHDTIGRDEITFLASYTGDVDVEKFEHILSYHLPDNLKDLEKKVLPGDYVK